MYINISYKFHRIPDRQSGSYNKSPRFTGTTLVYDGTPTLVNFVLLSLTELYYSKSCKFHVESTPVMESYYEVYF